MELPADPFDPGGQLAEGEWRQTGTRNGGAVRVQSRLKPDRAGNRRQACVDIVRRQNAIHPTDLSARHSRPRI
jgi:hypothetical protein